MLQNGLTEPESVRAATDDYQTSEDSLAFFIRESCARGVLLQCHIPQFRTTYEKHCAELGVEPLSGKAITQRLVAEYSVRSAKSNGRRVYKGITLIAEASEDDQ